MGPLGGLLTVIGGSVLLGKIIESLEESEEKNPRIFISHSWDFDNDYWKLIQNLGNYDFDYYNHSIDKGKALNAKTSKEIEEGVRRKIKGCSKVLILAGTYATREWIKKELEIARELNKEIIVVKPRGKNTVPNHLKYKADKIVGFNSKKVIEEIKDNQT